MGAITLSRSTPFAEKSSGSSNETKTSPARVVAFRVLVNDGFEEDFSAINYKAQKIL